MLRAGEGDSARHHELAQRGSGRREAIEPAMEDVERPYDRRPRIVDHDEAAELEVGARCVLAYQRDADAAPHVALHCSDAAELHDDLGLREVTIEELAARRSRAEADERSVLRVGLGRS